MICSHNSLKRGFDRQYIEKKKPEPCLTGLMDHEVVLNKYIQQKSKNQTLTKEHLKEMSSIREDFRKKQMAQKAQFEHQLNKLMNDHILIAQEFEDHKRNSEIVIAHLREQIPEEGKCIPCVSSKDSIIKEIVKNEKKIKAIKKKQTKDSNKQKSALKWQKLTAGKSTTS